jgi:16S rRNA processing protein RimM
MLEPADQQYVCIGRVARSHGVEGAILMIPDIDAPSLFDDIDLVRLEDARGDLIPARVQSVRVQKKNNRLSFFVKFDHITDRNQADAIKDFTIFASQQKIGHLLNDSSQAKATLISFDVVDESGKSVGKVTEVIGNPAHPILSVKSDDGRLLIPLVDEYVTETDEANETIHCQNIDRLIAE